METIFVHYTESPADAVAEHTGLNYEDVDLIDEGRIDEDGEHVLTVVYFPGNGKSVKLGDYGENDHARWLKL